MSSLTGEMLQIIKERTRLLGLFPKPTFQDVLCHNVFKIKDIIGKYHWKDNNRR